MEQPNRDSLSKDDLYLLLESYKNSVEMNTLISQQLTNILQILENCKNENTTIESNVIGKIEESVGILDKIRDKLENHNTESIKNTSKITNRVNLLYVAIGSVVLSLIVLVMQIIDKFDIIKAIALKLGV